MVTKKPAPKKAPLKKPAAKKPSTRKPRASIKPELKVKLADMIVNQTDLAEAIGISTRRLRQLEKEEEVIFSESLGKYRVGTVFQSYATYLREGAVKKTGNEGLDQLRAEKVIDARMTRMRKDRELISLDEALGTADELAGLFLSYLNGLPAEITKEPRERQRLHDIIDKGRLRLADRLGKKIDTLRTGQEDADSEDED
ncbi:hypothetical protein [Brucella pecoris]|uniref:DNA-binding XRE family transcriptional regulator n=1 Tax=Brucella pecoris TaxID=867683 RepID=A0A5C5CTB9_9HYPH|nr:hypothetical protein [Brucella pecoris]MBB4092449.1 DNA-binding XRE family transcriptional regulator [Brucella pecoris]TNV14291.1 hypothetical protein FIB18_03360 [Brucella pecoris]